MEVGGGAAPFGPGYQKMPREAPSNFIDFIDFIRFIGKVSLSLVYFS
jgi:hypothetical protein